jgi:hypothetical protein
MKSAVNRTCIYEDAERLAKLEALGAAMTDSLYFAELPRPPPTKVLYFVYHQLAFGGLACVFSTESPDYLGGYVRGAIHSRPMDIDPRNGIPPKIQQKLKESKNLQYGQVLRPIDKKTLESLASGDAVLKSWFPSLFSRRKDS